MQPSDRHNPSHNTNLGNRLLGWEHDNSQPEQPGDALWYRIEADLPARPNRRLFIWWWVGILLVAVTAAGVYYKHNLPKAVRQLPPAAGADVPCREDLPPRDFFPTTAPTATSSRPVANAAALATRSVSGFWPQATQPSNAPTAEPRAMAIPDTLLSLDSYASAIALPPSLSLGYDSLNTLENTPRLLNRTVFPLQVEPELQNKRSGQLYLSLYTALTDNNYAWQQTAPGHLSPVRSRQQLSWRNEWGGNIRYAHGRWSLSAGLAAYSGELRSLSRYRRLFDPGQEQITPEGNALSTYSLGIANPYGNADINVEIQRNAMTNPPPHATLFFTVASAQRMRAWQLPLQLGYHIPLGKIQLGICAGPVFELHQLEALQARIQVSAPGQFVMRPAGVPRQQTATQISLVSWSLALELSYPFSDNMSMYIRPFGQYSGSQLQPEQTVKYTRWGSQLGISIRILN